MPTGVAADAACLMEALPLTIVRRIVECCDVASACALTSTCVALHVLQHDDRCDGAQMSKLREVLTRQLRPARNVRALRSVWECISVRTYGAAFWVAAAARPADSARRLGSRRLELLRMHSWERRFQLKYNRSWVAAEYIKLWRWRDGREELHVVLPHMRVVSASTSAVMAEGKLLSLEL